MSQSWNNIFDELEVSTQIKRWEVQLLFTKKYKLTTLVVGKWRHATAQTYQEEVIRWNGTANDLKHKTNQKRIDWSICS